MKPRVGTMLPCNGILGAVEGGAGVSASDPAAPMQAIDTRALRTRALHTRALHAVAGQVRDLPATGDRRAVAEAVHPAVVAGLPDQRVSPSTRRAPTR